MGIASIAVVALGLGGLVGLLLVNAVLSTLAVVDRFRAVDPASIPVRRSLPDVVALGASATISWEIENPADRRIHVDFADELVP
jgi:hypothetical protein